MLICHCKQLLLESTALITINGMKMIPYNRFLFFKILIAALKLTSKCCMLAGLKNTHPVITAGIWICISATAGNCVYEYSHVCVCVQVPVAGSDHLPCGAAMLCRPFPFRAGQLYHGNLYGCRCAPSGLVIKAKGSCLLCLQQTRSLVYLGVLF